ncbi:MAG TPA: glucose 1-dehydrogenase, partial [Thermomicrobiales bacterium]|nr:glucose 1-dehydrogenase [Thermomicrobiales bacterium]
MNASSTPTATMAAVAVYPGRAGSIHRTTLPLPTPGPGQALVRVRRVGVCGTDQEIIHGQFGSPPPGSDELVLGHEALGEVEALDPAAEGVDVGDLVVCTVRRPGGCVPCVSGQADMCADLEYTEYGIIGAHGFMVERFVMEPEHLIRVPAALEPIGILTEPLSVVEKALQQATLIQRRIPSWAPRTAIVLGAGPIGILGTLLLRSRGMDVVTVARRPGPHAISRIIEASGARYAATRQQTLAEIAAGLPPVDLIFEATGVADLAFDAMEILGANGVLVLLSLTGGGEMKELPIARLNRSFVLGNKVMVGSVNSSREHFELAVADLGRFETLWPGLAA